MIYSPSKKLLNNEGKKRSPENKTSLFCAEYWSKAVLNLAMPPSISP
jgi:hypothetical protein